MSISILNQGNSFGISSSSSSGIITAFVFDSTGLGNIGIGTTIFTGTANQNLQVGGGAYIAGSVGVGTTNPTGIKLDFVGNARVSGTVTFSQSAGDTFLVTSRAVPTTDMINISNLGFPVTSAGVNNLQIDFVGGAAAVEAGAVRVGITTGGTSGSTWNAFRILPTTGAGSGVVLNALKCDTITPAVGTGTDNALFVGTGWDNIINFNNTPIINGVGEFVSRINSLSGVSTFGSGSTILIGGGTSTGTASQPLQVTGGAYVSGALGIGTTNPAATGSTLGVAGTITELTGSTYWNLISQYDVGIGASQVPLNQYLGQLAFADQYSPYGLRRDGGGSDDVTVNSSGFVGVGTTNAIQLFQVGAATSTFVVTGIGSVGIGTTNPLALLQVGASPTTPFVVTGIGSVGIGNTNPSTPLNIIKDGTTATAAIITAQPLTGSRASFIQFANTGVSNFNAGLLNSAGALAGFTGGPAYGGFIGLSGANPLIFATNSLERVRIFDTGEVGIGTTNPTAKLDIFGGPGGTTGLLRLITPGDVGVANTTVFLRLNDVNGNAGYFGFGGTANLLDIVNYKSGSFRILTNNTEALRVDSSQRVGIGTTNPGGLLQVGASPTAPFVVTQVGTTVSVGIGTTNPGTNQLQVGVGTTAVVVTGIGSVGIGSTNPAYTLDVNGNMRVTGTLTNSSFVAFSVAFGI